MLADTHSGRLPSSIGRHFTSPWFVVVLVYLVIIIGHFFLTLRPGYADLLCASTCKAFFSCAICVAYLDANLMVFTIKDLQGFKIWRLHAFKAQQRRACMRIDTLACMYPHVHPQRAVQTCTCLPAVCGKRAHVADVHPSCCACRCNFKLIKLDAMQVYMLNQCKINHMV